MVATAEQPGYWGLGIGFYCGEARPRHRSTSEKDRLTGLIGDVFSHERRMLNIEYEIVSLKNLLSTETPNTNRRSDCVAHCSRTLLLTTDLVATSLPPCSRLGVKRRTDLT
jgi:hypothetical protein